MTAIACLCTCPDAAHARRLADALVGEGLAACVNLLPGVISVYRWQGRVEEAQEVLLLIKTAGDRFDALSARITDLHPYDLPEVIRFDIDGGLPAYLDWITGQSRPGASI